MYSRYAVYSIIKRQGFATPGRIQRTFPTGHDTVDANKQQQAEAYAQALADNTGKIFGVYFEKRLPEIGSPIVEQHKVSIFTPTEAAKE